MGKDWARSRRPLGWGAALATVVLGLAVGPVALSGAVAEDEPVGPGSEALNDPWIQKQIAAEQAEAASAAAAREKPAEVAAREAARTAYGGMSGDAAKRLAEQSFADLISTPTWEPFKPFAGTEIKRYYGTHSALVAPVATDIDPANPPATTRTLKPPTESGGLVESILPLQAESESGGLRPVDPGLVDRGSYLEPANAPVEAELPDHLADGVALPELDLELSPQGAERAAPVELIGPDKAFYANSDTDTDFMVTPTPTGIETFLQLRSERSPEEHALALDLPAGAHLESAMQGMGATVIAGDGEPLATVTPPMAFDADGTYVPVSMQVAGDELVLSVAHRAGDWKYPLLVDPVLERFYFNWSGGCADLSYWEWGTFWPNKFFKGCGAAATGGYGISTLSLGGYQYAANEFAQWVWRAPPNTFIESVRFAATEHAHSAGEEVCTVHGIFNPYANQWETGFAVFNNTFTGGPTTGCNPWANGNFSQSVGYYDDLRAGDPQGSNGNMAVFQLFMHGFEYRSNHAWNLMRDAGFTIYDRFPPEFTSDPPPSSGWTDDSLPGGGRKTYTHTVRATDLGVGMRYYWFLTPKGNPQGEWNVDGRDRGCSGIRFGGCSTPDPSWTQTFNYQLPEGLNDAGMIAFDQISQASTQPYGWQQKIDRSAPALSLGGSLRTGANAIVADQSYNLNISATDGSTANAAAMRSGVQSVEVFVDDEEEPRFTAAQNCGSSQGSCPMNRTWTTGLGEFSDGISTVRVVAADMLGHTRTQQFSIDVDGDDQEPNVTTTFGLPAPDGTYGLQIDATDTGPHATGVTRFEIYVDGTLATSFDQACPTGGCSMSRTAQMSGAQAPSAHEIGVFADDQAGNRKVQVRGRRSPPAYIGYNDDFAMMRSDLRGHARRLALDGGANILRFPVSWCVIARGLTTPQQQSDPTKGAWGPYGQLFQAVKDYNASHQTRPLRLLPVALGAPKWAQGLPPSEQQNCDITTPPGATYLHNWQAFVNQILVWWGAPEFGIIGIEVWNEPNLPEYWGGGLAGDFDPQPQRFAGLYNRAASKINAYDPTPDNPNDAASVFAIPGGLSSSGLQRRDADTKTYMQRATDPNRTPHIAPGAVDLISLHFYANEAHCDK